MSTNAPTQNPTGYAGFIAWLERDVQATEAKIEDAIAYDQRLYEIEMAMYDPNSDWPAPKNLGTHERLARQDFRRDQDILEAARENYQRWYGENQ